MRTRSFARVIFTLIVLVTSRTAYAQVSLSPTSLSFGNVAVNNTSAAKNVTFANKTTAATSITSITTGTGSPFAVKSTTCGSSLGASKNCTISVTFTPTALGTVSGTLTVTDSGTPSSLAVTLTGTGVNPVNLSPSKLSFGSITLGSSSSASSTTLKNVQNVPLTISSIMASANFRQTNNCPLSPNTLAAGATCSISVAFTPPALGTTSGTLTIVHNAYGSPTTASLSGNGVLPVVLSPTALNFGFEKIGTTSESKNIEVTNEQPVALTITSIQTTGDFNQTNNCPLVPATLLAGASCSVNVTFSPTVAGIRTGQLSVSDSAVTSPQTVALSGSGGAVLQSISVTPSTASIAVGQTQQFTATGFYNDGSQKNLTASATWKSSSSKVATVSAGLATGVAAGKAFITATQSGISGSATLTATNLTLKSIAVTPANPSIALGTQQQLHATGTYSNGSTLDITNSVTWASSSSAIATISSTGLATSKGIGQATISASSGTVSGSAVLTVTAAQLVAISVTPLSASIPLGTTQQFTATGTFSDGTMQNLTTTATWTSSQTAIAIVTAGLAIPVSTGTVTITAAVGSTSGSASLTVNAAALVSIAVTPPTLSVALGNSQQFTATGTFTDGSTENLTTQVSWGSANTAIASVNSAGLAMTVATGTTQITATSGSITNSATLAVTAAALVTVTVTPATPMVPLGETQQFAATGTFTDKSIQDITQTVSWSSSNPAVASISMTTGTIGLATALSRGTTTIAATQGAASGNTTLTVNPAALVSITLSPSPLNLPYGTTQQLSASGKYSDGTTQTLTAGVTWTSSDASIATVSASGLVTAVAATGSATISAQDGNVTGSLVVQVSNAVLVSIAISPSTASIPLGTTQQFTASGTYSDNSTQNLTSTVQWMSSIPTIATISVSAGTAGLAQSLTTGSTTITAVSGSVSTTATLTVTPAALVSISIAPSAPSIDLGRSQQFTATGTYTDGSSNDLTRTTTWSASPATVAVISNQAGSQGLATSAGVGSATITATLGGVSSSTTLTVGPSTIVSIAVTPATSMISVGLAQQFTATATYTDGSTNDVTASVTWSTSAASVAAVNNNVATGVSPGTATIAAASGSVQGTASLLVLALPLISSFVPAAITITSGSAITLTANFVNGTGLVNPGAIAVASGVSVNLTPTTTTTYTLTVINAAGTFVAAQATVTVVPPPAITSFTAGANTISVGGSTTLTAVFSGGTGSIDNGVGAVSSGVSLNVTPAATTTYTLTVVNSAGTSTTAATTVTVSSATLLSISITPANPSIALGATTQFTATGTYSHGSTKDLTSTATWNSSAPGVAAISATGLATAAASGCGGSATISATVGAITGTTRITALVIGGSTCGGNLTIARDPHTSTLLPDGTVLVAGGISPAGTAVASAEIYTPSTNISAALPVSMTTARASHTATLLTNGKVLLVGGFDASGNPLVSAEIFDPTAPNSSGGLGAFAATGSLSTARFRHAATLLSDGTVLITGGYAAANPLSPTASAEIYNPASGAFTQFTGATNVSGGVTTSHSGMTMARGDHTATLLEDGSGDVLIAGGLGGTLNPSNTYELYDPSCVCFYNFADASGNPLTMSDYRALHTATLLGNGTVFLAGGQETFGGTTSASATSYISDLYNPATNLMTSAPSPSTPRYSHTATFLSNGLVLIAGGVTYSAAGAGSNSVTGTMELYDPASGSWTATNSLQTPRYEQTATALNSGIVFINGGADSAGNPLSSFELYSPTSLVPVGLSGSISVAPSGQQLPVGLTQTFTATAVVNGVTESLTNVTWTSSNPGVLTLATDGLGNAVATPLSSASLPQVVTVQACFGSDATHCGRASVTVTPKQLVSVSVTPPNPYLLMPPGNPVQFTAVGLYTDGSSGPVSSLSWTSSVTTVALINSATGQATPATPLQYGTTTITASAPGPSGVITGSSILTVTNVATTASLATALANGTATILNCPAPCPRDGQVLVVGGSSAQVYDPVLQTFSLTTGSMSYPRDGFHTATVLDNGDVLIAGGGVNTLGTQTAEVYSPRTDTFTTVGSMSVVRILHTATLIHCTCPDNGKVLIAGGDSGGNVLQTAELFDPASGTFSLAGTMFSAREHFTATLLNSTTGQVLLAGGIDSSGSSTNTAETYDPTAGKFSQTPGNLASFPAYSCTPPGREGHTATLLNTGQVLIAGGVGQSSCAGSFGVPTFEELFDPASGQFNSTAGLAYPRLYYTATLLENGTVLIAGGVPTNFTLPPLPTNELFDPTGTGSFSLTGNLNTPREDLSAALLPSGNVLIVGGSNPYLPSPGVLMGELYQPTSLTPTGVTQITVTAALSTISVNTAVHLTATGNNGQQLNAVTWSATPTGIVTITNDGTNSGTAYAVAPGSVTVTACAGSVCSNPGFVVSVQ